MTEKAYNPAAKPTANGGAAPTPTATAANRGANPTFPASKAQLYNATRPAYRPQPPRRGSRRSCCCSLCLWSTLLIILILLLAALAGGVFFAIYRPHRPSFSVAAVQLSRFNLTDTTVTSAFNVTLIARNRNGEIAFFYDATAVRILSSGVDLASGSFPAFAHGKRNVTTLKAAISSTNAPIDGSADPTALKSSVKSRSLALKVQLDTKVKVKIGKIKTPKLKIRVTCEKISIAIPTGKTASLATTSKAKCKVDPRIKIFKWTV